MIKPRNYSLNHKNPPIFPSMISIIQQNPGFPRDFSRVFHDFSMDFPSGSLPHFSPLDLEALFQQLPSAPPSMALEVFSVTCGSSGEGCRPGAGWSCQKKSGHPRTAWWWLEPWNFITFYILGISSSQLTLTPSFFRGVGGSTTNQS